VSAAAPTAVDKQLLAECEALADGELYAACRTNCLRASNLQMAARYAALVRIVCEIQPCTVRQTYYQATVRGVVEKTQAGYDKVQRALVDLRMAGKIPFRSITDNTRWQIKPITYNSMEDALDATAHLYRRAVWSDVDSYVEFWLEKDALAGVIHPITSRYDVPLMVARGFSSLSFLHNAAEHIESIQKPAYVYQLGDHDPSGVCAGQKIEEMLRRFAPRAEIHFERLVVLPHQIAQWNLPTRPTKKTDSRARNFEGDSVEMDAIHPETLRQLVQEVIVAHLPPDQLRVLKVAEESERRMLRMFAHDEIAEGKKGKDGVFIVQPNPTKAFELLQSLLEYHVPKLSRAEMIIEDDGPIDTNDISDLELARRILFDLHEAECAVAAKSTACTPTSGK
jgi:hypothetical protein